MVRGSAAAVADLGSRILKKGAAASRGGSRIAGRGSRRISADLGPWVAGLVGLRSHADGGPLRI